MSYKNNDKNVGSITYLLNDNPREGNYLDYLKKQRNLNDYRPAYDRFNTKRQRDVPDDHVCDCKSSKVMKNIQDHRKCCYDEFV